MPRRTRKQDQASSRAAVPVPRSQPRAPFYPWGLLSSAAPLILLLHSFGATFGEPAADDFDFLYHTLLSGGRSLLDGGGSSSFWRPLSHQIYYSLLGHIMLASPWVISALHIACLSLLGYLLYSISSRFLSPPLAAVSASFVFLMESTRSLVVWPSHFVELGMILFSTLAVSLALNYRIGLSILALLLALLCKELAILTVVPLALTIWRTTPHSLRARRLTVLLLPVFAWTLLQFQIRSTAKLGLPQSITIDPVALWPTFLQRTGWAISASLRSAFSLPLRPGPFDALVGTSALIIIGASLLIHMRRRPQTLSLGFKTPIGGAVWFLGTCCALATTFPTWAPYRSIFGNIGLGFALTGLTSTASTFCTIGLLVLRVVMFAASPGPSTAISPVPKDNGAFLDFQRLTRLQRLMRETRHTLLERYFSLPARSLVGQHFLPQGAQYAFGGSKALRLWYRDTTVSWVRFEDFVRDPSLDLVTVVEYQPHARRQIALVSTEAMRMHLQGRSLQAVSQWDQAIHAYDTADSLQANPTALVFLASNAYNRAFCLGAIGAFGRAEQEAYKAIATGQVNANARYTLAIILLSQDRLREADGQLDTLLREAPTDSDALQLRATIRGSSY